MPNTIERHFVTLEGRWGVRQVHFRRAGSGPLVLLLHQSPQSSRELQPLMTQWAKHFTVIAPDTPGYGLSDPLGVAVAELSDFASATLELADAIGAGRFGVYGFHTGGMIGIALADAYPERVAALACNGVLMPTEAELAELLKFYLPPFEPRWDGGHLAWTWARNREQTIFFPWYKPSLDGRMDCPLPAPAQQQINALEFFRAGDHYRVAYRAAFVFHAENVIPRLRVPALITASARDPLQPHLARVKTDLDNPDSVSVVGFASPDDVGARCLALLQANPGEAVPDTTATQPVPGRLWRQMLATDGGYVHCRRGGDLEAPAILILHAAGGSSATVAGIAAQLAGASHVIALDLPGHGESVAPAEAAESALIGAAAAVQAVMRALDLGPVSLLGYGSGALVALELAQAQPASISRLALIDVPVMSATDQLAWREHGMPSLAPEWSGGHLLRCWHMVRDGRLFFPWFRCDPQGIRWQQPELDDESIQLEVTEYLKAEGSWQEMLAQALDYPLADRLDSLTVPVCLCVVEHSPGQQAVHGAAKTAGIPCQLLPPGSAEQAKVLQGLLMH